MKLNSKQITEYTGGNLLVEPIDASRISSGLTWDTRSISEGDTFVALPGERVDGHAFVPDALRAGASIILVSDRPEAETLLLAREMGAAIIEVSDTLVAITDIARAWRKALRGQVIALTGSSGKTTTKNLIRDVLSASFRVVATEGNQNNELGVPNTILSADPETQVIVVEMGMRGRGQIAQLCEFAAPDMGLITNVGEGHIELLGSKENIALAKAELFEALPEGNGRAFLNRRDAFAGFIVENTDLKSRRVGLTWFDGSGTATPYLKENDDVEGSVTEDEPFASWGAWAEEIKLDSQGRPRFTLHVGLESQECLVPLRGAHNVHNACAAASVGSALGMDIQTIVSAIEEAKPECGRQDVLTAPGDYLVIDDTYNANPDSMRAALLMLASYGVRGRRVAVLGDMGELGDFSEACHKGIGQLAAELDLDRLICVGELASFIASEARGAGMESDKILHVESIPDVLTDLESYAGPGDVVLVKASRFMGLERVVGGLVN